MAEIGKLVGNTFVCNGKLVADAATKTAKGKTFVELRVVNNPTFGSDEGIFFDVPLWGDKAPEIFGGMKKGEAVSVSGTLDIRYWEDKKDGSKRFAFSVKFAQVTRLAKKETTAEAPAVDEGEATDDPTAGL